MAKRPFRLLPFAGLWRQAVALLARWCLIRSAARTTPILKYAACAPKLNPAVLVPYGPNGKHLGLVPTLSVTEYPASSLARVVSRCRSG
jgi:hypothetical protein